jgi:hypothetical protein
MWQSGLVDPFLPVRGSAAVRQDLAQNQTLAVCMTASQREKGPVYVGILNASSLRPTFRATSRSGMTLV